MMSQREKKKIVRKTNGPKLYGNQNFKIEKKTNHFLSHVQNNHLVSI